MFGRLTVIADCGQTDKSYSIWLCHCDCGKEKVIKGRQMTSGSTISCGCVQRESAAKLNAIHGCGGRKKKTRAYNAWRAMMQRCYNENFIRFPNYGGRGITVCERWRGSFVNFLEDMGEAPTNKHSIDRFPNVNGNYEPSNCRWATREQQDKGKTSNVWIEHDGKKMIKADWARHLGMKISSFNGALRRKHTIEEIINKKQKRNV